MRALYTYRLNFCQNSPVYVTNNVNSFGIIFIVNKMLHPQKLRIWELLTEIVTGTLARVTKKLGNGRNWSYLIIVTFACRYICFLILWIKAKNVILQTVHNKAKQTVITRGLIHFNVPPLVTYSYETQYRSKMFNKTVNMIFWLPSAYCP